MKVLLSPHLNQHLLFSGFVVFCIIAILMGVKWYCVETLICIFLRTNDVEHLLTCILAICVSSLEKCLLPTFKLGLLAFYCFVLRVLYIFWILVPYQIHDLHIFLPILRNVFSPS